MKDFGRWNPLMTHRAAVGLCRRGPVVMRFSFPARRAPPLPHWRDTNPHCPVCGLPRYRFGDWRETAGPNNGGRWHAPCAAAYRLWSNSALLGDWLAGRQAGLCAETREDLRSRGEVDHRVPLWRVCTLGLGWPEVLNFWGPGNLQLLSPEAHGRKTAREAAARAQRRIVPAADLFAWADHRKELPNVGT
jgi:5-methylcytosine-specific restriction endonuclease McrA